MTRITVSKLKSMQVQIVTSKAEFTFLGDVSNKYDAEIQLVMDEVEDMTNDVELTIFYFLMQLNSDMTFGKERKSN